MLRSIFILWTLLLLNQIYAEEPLEIGAKVKAVKATNQDGKLVDLGAELAKGISLVYFYPKASTGG